MCAQNPRPIFPAANVRPRPIPRIRNHLGQCFRQFAAAIRQPIPRRPRARFPKIETEPPPKRKQNNAVPAACVRGRARTQMQMNANGPKTNGPSKK